MASETEELKFKFYLVLININLNSYMCLVATVQESTDLEGQINRETDMIIIKCSRCYDRNISKVLSRIGSDISGAKWNPE